MVSRLLRVALFTLAITGLSSATHAEVVGKINYQKYFQSALVLSTVSAAIAGLGQCDQLHFEETLEGQETLALWVTCKHEGGGKSGVIVRFNSYGDNFLTPKSFQYAG